MIEKNYASIGSRFLALIVDNIILIPVSLLPYALSLFGLAQGAPFFRLAGVLGHFFYGAFFYSQYGKTPGKMLLDIQVTNVDTGLKPSFLVGGFRDTLGRFLDMLTLGIGYLIAFFRADKRALHDLLFNTIVIQELKKLP